MYKITWTLPKIGYGIGGTVVALTHGVQTAMAGLMICLAVDTITGFIAAPYRGQRRTSTGLRQAVPKIITYMGAGLLAHICETLIFPSWARGELELGCIVFSFFAGCEVMSCFENMKDITGLKAFDLLTFNFKKQVENKIGIDLGDVNDKKRVAETNDKAHKS